MIVLLKKKLPPIAPPQTFQILERNNCGSAVYERNYHGDNPEANVHGDNSGDQNKRLQRKQRHFQDMLGVQGGGLKVEKVGRLIFDDF